MYVYTYMQVYMDIHTNTYMRICIYIWYVCMREAENRDFTVIAVNPISFCISNI